MTPKYVQNCIAFAGTTEIARGLAVDVALAVKASLAADDRQQILVFDAITSEPIDFDLRGDEAAIRARLMPESAPTGPGRPKLGVIAREVTLLPQHWEWLAGQPGGASVTLRKLVETARRQSSVADCQRMARDSVYRLMSAMAGNEPGFEEASRALFAGDARKFADEIKSWPGDLRRHLTRLTESAFGEAATGG